MNSVICSITELVESLGTWKKQIKILPGGTHIYQDLKEISQIIFQEQWAVRKKWSIKEKKPWEVPVMVQQ